MVKLASLFARLSRDPSDPVLLSRLHTLYQQPDSEIDRCLAQEGAPCREALAALFARPSIRARWLSRLAVAQVRARHRLDEARAVDPSLLAALANDRICLLLLSELLNTDATLERVWTRVRRNCLLNISVEPVAQPLLAALAVQAWNNEYLWNEAAEETDHVTALAAEIDAGIKAGDLAAVTVPLLRWAMYRPLTALPAAEALAARPLAAIPPVLHQLWQRTLRAPRQEAHLRAAMPAFGQIKDANSRAAQAQYEENPYPRWLRLSVPHKSVLEQIRACDPTFAWPAKCRKSVQILVAGCGTGQHPLGLAAANRDAQVLAVDLSAASLAYAQRMARDLGIDNIRFLQGDLLQLRELGQRFHHIECVGVLHDLGDQEAAWKSLTAVLHPGGTFRVGVTSKVACLPLAHLRARVAREEVEPTLEAVRAFRERLLREPKSASTLARILAMDDFFSVSMVRHLFFPTCGYQYTLDELERHATACGLRLLGYRLPRQVRRHIAHTSGRPTFAQWRGLEMAYAGSFGMFLCLLHLPAGN